MVFKAEMVVVAILTVGTLAFHQSTVASGAVKSDEGVTVTLSNLHQM